MGWQGLSSTQSCRGLCWQGTHHLVAVPFGTHNLHCHWGTKGRLEKCVCVIFWCLCSEVSDIFISSHIQMAEVSQGSHLIQCSLSLNRYCSALQMSIMGPKGWVELARKKRGGKCIPGRMNNTFKNSGSKETMGLWTQNLDNRGLPIHATISSQKHWSNVRSK